jgi:hypothetical protein
MVLAQDTGWIRKGARLIEAYQKEFSFEPAAAQDAPYDMERQRKISKGMEAMKRILRSLFEPEQAGNYSSCTMSRLVQPLSAIVAEPRRAESERFLLTSADQLQQLSNEEINRFLRDFRNQGEIGALPERHGAYQAVADLLRNENFPELVQHVNALFHEKAVKPALDFFATKIDDGSLQRVLLFLRRILGFRG